MQKTDKLINCMRALLVRLEERNIDVSIYRCIDQYFYIQKIEELTLISIQRVRLSPEQSAKHYEEIYYRWRKDALWLNKHLLFGLPCPSQSF